MGDFEVNPGQSIERDRGGLGRHLPKPWYEGDLRYTSDEERVMRLSRLRREMREAALDALIVVGRDDIRYRGRTFYVSDIWQLLAESFVLITHAGSPSFLGGPVWGLEEARRTNWVGDFDLSGAPGACLGEMLQRAGLGRGSIGIVGLSDASFAAWHLDELRKTIPGALITDATELFESVRQTNSAEALERLMQTSSVFRDIFSEVRRVVRPASRELSVAAEIHRLAREAGLRDPMVMIQTTPFGPASFGTQRLIEGDDLVTVWVESAGPWGYWLEYRECYTFGPPPAKVRDFWSLQKDALRSGLAKLRPGAMASEFVRTVQESLSAFGFGLGYHDAGDQRQMYSLHGIGTDAIQGVWVPGKDRVLKDTEVVNVHPTVSFVEREQKLALSWLGVTDNVLVTEDGGQLLTHDKGMSAGLLEL